MPMVTTEFKSCRILDEHLTVPYSTGSNNTIMLCMEKSCCWMNFGCGLQKSPGYRIFVSLIAEAGNAQPSGEGIGVGKRVKQHNSKVQSPVCVGGKTLTTCFPCFGSPRWEMICRCFRSVYISTQTTGMLLYSCHVLPALGKQGLLHSEGKSLGSLGIALLPCV